MSDNPQYVTERTFKAPRDLVWKAWTDPKLLAEWYGPGVETIIHEFDLRPGGVWRNEMKKGDFSMCSKITFQEVTPPEKLVWHNSSTDADWNIAANPMMPDWPKTILTTITFEEKEEGTHMRLTWEPFEATDAEIACFAGAMDGFGKGWGAGFAILEELLAKLQG